MREGCARLLRDDVDRGALLLERLGDQLRERWEKLGQPCSERTIERALACADRRARAHDHGRADWLASRTGLDRTAIWEWGVVERVSTALLGIEIDLQPVAGEMLDAAEKISCG